jgi:uncharacterized protein
MSQAHPVNFTSTAGTIWPRTDGTGALGRLPSGARVAFEVDSIDAWRHTGWSVLVTGYLRVADNGAFP